LLDHPLAKLARCPVKVVLGVTEGVEVNVLLSKPLNELVHLFPGEMVTRGNPDVWNLRRFLHSIGNPITGVCFTHVTFPFCVPMLHSWAVLLPLLLQPSHPTGRPGPR